jgi:chemotaxis protein methyltransferase CheR
MVDVQKFTRNYQESGGVQPFSTYYTAAHEAVKFDRALTKNVTFADHSLVTDAVFSEMHLISCRNVLIYFDRELQDRAFGLFHESLVRKGFLGLGSQETVYFSPFARHFTPFVKSQQIFQKA